MVDQMKHLGQGSRWRLHCGWWPGEVRGLAQRGFAGFGCHGWERLLARFTKIWNSDVVRGERAVSATDLPPRLGCGLRLVDPLLFIKA